MKPLVCKLFRYEVQTRYVIKEKVHVTMYLHCDNPCSQLLHAKIATAKHRKCSEDVHQALGIV